MTNRNETKELTREQILQWATSHVDIPHRLVYNDDAGYKVEYQNGETYERRESYNGYFEKTVVISINGCVVNTGRYIFGEFSWIRA